MHTSIAKSDLALGLPIKIIDRLHLGLRKIKKKEKKKRKMKMGGKSLFPGLLPHIISRSKSKMNYEQTKRFLLVRWWSDLKS